MNEYGQVCWVVEGKPQERRPLGRPRHRWERDTESGLKGIGWNSAFWIHYIWDGEQGDSCEQGNGPSDVIIGGQFVG